MGDPVRAVLEREGPAGRRGRHPRGTGHRNAVTASWRGPRYGPAVFWLRPVGVGRGHNAELVAVRIRQDMPCPAVLANRTPVSTAAPKPVTRRRPEPVTLRWILFHLTGETARHNGHIGILRELADGARGR